MTTDRRAPWTRPAPAGAGHTKLTPALQRLARARAEAAGRRYPNLVDNMWAAQQARGSATSKPGAKATKKKAKPRAAGKAEAKPKPRAR